MEDEYKKRLRLIIRSLTEFGEVQIRVEGNSMVPVLNNGTLIKISKKSFREIRPTDWVAVVKKGQLMVHEILFRDKNYLISWGVNNSRTDGTIRPGQILGIVKKPENWRRWHLIYLSEAKLISTEFKKTGIRNLVLKGPPWQICKYNFLLDKPSADTDWLIDRKKYQTIKKTLTANGYHLKPLTWVDKSFYLGNAPEISEMSYIKKIVGQPVTIDLHLNAVREAHSAWYKEPITPDNMRHLTHYFLQKRVWSKGWPVLSDTDSLFYLCTNLMFHHAGRGIYQLANIAHLVNRKKINWRKLEHLGREYRMSNYLYFPLLWATRFFKVKVPILEKIQPTSTRLWLAKIVLNRWTVVRPLPAGRWWPSRFNLFSIQYLRFVLSLRTH